MSTTNPVLRVSDSDAFEVHALCSRATVVATTSAEEFLDAIGPDAKTIGPPDYTDPCVYRGHADAEWELLPAAWRKDGRAKLAPLTNWLGPQIVEILGRRAMADRLTKKYAEQELVRSLSVAVEIYAVRQFCDLADELGMLIPDAERVMELSSIIELTTTGGLSHSMLDGSQPSIEYFVDTPFAFAQHHGIPTRYLDWTRNPFIAAYFATTDPGADPSGRICVWRATRSDVSSPNARMHWVRVPRSGHAYLHAQNGLFLFCGDLLGGAWDKPPGVPMTQVTLPRTEVPALRELLHGKHRISKAHLMPTLDNVAEVSRDKWGWMGSAIKSDRVAGSPLGHSVTAGAPEPTL